MTRHNVALGLILGLASGTFFVGVRANGQNATPGTPVHMVVSVESRHGGEAPKINREDVVVTEGFAGNIALKTAEGTARQIAVYLRAAMSRTLLARIGYFLARDAFDRLREKMDPRRVNGGVFLGLQGIVIKSHGGTDAEAAF